MSSRPLIKQCFLYPLISKCSLLPVALLVTVWLGKSTSTSVFGSLLMLSNSSARKSSLTTTGNTKLFSSLFLCMSAKKLLITTLKPYPAMAHAACSRLEPQPKFLPATRMTPPYFGSLSTKSFFKEPSLLYLQSLNRFSPKPVGCFQKTCRNDLVCIDVFQRQWNAGARYNIKLLFHLQQILSLKTFST